MSFESFDIYNILKTTFEKGIVRGSYTINAEITMILELKKHLQDVLRSDENSRLLLDFRTGEIYLYPYKTFTATRYGTYFATDDQNMMKFIVYITNSLVNFLKNIGPKSTFYMMDFDGIPFFNVRIVYSTS